MSVNLPRWGLKLHRFADSVVKRFGCKFTPLGFETLFHTSFAQVAKCKFTPLGFETSRLK